MEILIFKKLAKEMYYELELTYETTELISLYLDAALGSLIFQNKKFLLSELKNILIDRYVLEMEKSLKSLFFRIFFYLHKE